MTEEPGINPYTPPSAELKPARGEGEDAGLFPASNNKRFANYVIDTIAFYALAANLDTIFIAVDDAVPVAWILRFFEALGEFGPFLLGVSVTVIYYFFQEAIFGRTLGKWITRTKVVTLDGKHPHVMQLLGRTLARLVPCEPFSFLGSNGWHDRWSGTVVIDLTADEDLKISPKMRKFFR
ncbi:RDD family protein [Brevifollis gellanilyticus]|uniref:RDD domain-containing protein n=1 Tax=Brevifollis gellanilyticus TaxID=748831 RepID=A0A512MI76_9BACT|nr:RDD family protein [Brevifollis gellanilyticus]GEP46446.1 hypothetical protein BGE01nite_57370 [Brevifollis gellanilyticus]